MSHINFATAKRRSIRSFTNAPIDPDAIRDIMECALRAPSSRNSKSTYFILIEDIKTLQKLSECRSSGAKFVANAPLAIAVCADRHKAVRAYTDCAIAASYIQLAVTDLDLGSCWCQVAELEAPDGGSAENYVRQTLDLPQDDYVLCIIAVGHPTNDNDLEPRPQELEWERVYTEKYEER